MDRSNLWVFGYGSLIWDPGFDFVERRLARLEGYHRCFCMRSVHYRGTAQAPGLVLALDRAERAVCRGVAYGVPAETREDVLAYLRERELISYAYVETLQPVLLEGGTRVEAVTYVIDPAHEQYCGGLSLEEQARIIARAEGRRGPNRDYLLNTAAQLAELDIEDDEIAWLARRVRSLNP
ncbi:gamma-glutamylcyclotransferase [Alkalilacustris brevis]|uniref:gamma-glutamylcyclotransferase n=1 Tax=Alkalilacustris brevis TaxID=2026338 RepID=UPI000E0D437F|nr:gamma-glutamylcyclotransferase [Alkalilacustris brevis]